MTQPTCCEKLREYLCNYVGKPSIRDDEPLGMDSLGFIRLTAFIESDLRLEIPDEELCAESFTDWNTICEMITRHHPAALSAPCYPSEPDATEPRWSVVQKGRGQWAIADETGTSLGFFAKKEHLSCLVDRYNQIASRRSASRDREMEELRKKNEELWSKLAIYHSEERTIKELRAARDVLEHRLATAEADTNRLNWLASHGHRVDVTAANQTSKAKAVHYGIITELADLREAIDAAKEQKK